MTPGAVSQMLKTLEVHLGIRLFHRVNRGIQLTDAGQGYLPPVRNAFRQIAEASRRVAASVETGVLTLSVTPFFATSWLVPRLTGFQAAHPEIDLRVVTGTALVDFSRDGVDLAIRHGFGRYPGLASDRVVAVEIVPVATADLVATHGRPDTPADLTRWPQVHDAERKAWNRWFEARGVDDIGSPRGSSFDDAGLLLQAVLAGQGAGLLPAALVRREIEDGRLVELAGSVLVEDIAYYLICPRANRARPKVRAFREWILATARRGTPGTGTLDARPE